MQTLIHDLGGPSTVAAELGGDVTPKAVSNWGKRGVPWRYRPAVKALADKLGVAVPSGFLGTREAA